MSDTQGTGRTAIVLDYLPHGRQSGSDRRFDKDPLVQALGIRDFRLYEIVLEEGADISIGAVLSLRPPESPVDKFRELAYDDLSRGAASELEYVVEEVIERDEDRFVNVFNEAQPITLRLHQLTLMPGIGDKLRDQIIDERRRGPFDSFADVADRIDGLHDPKSVICDRILEELRDDNVKYALFVGGPF